MPSHIHTHTQKKEGWRPRLLLPRSRSRRRPAMTGSSSAGWPRNTQVRAVSMIRPKRTPSLASSQRSRADLKRPPTLHTHMAHACAQGCPRRLTRSRRPRRRLSRPLGPAHPLPAPSTSGCGAFFLQLGVSLQPEGIATDSTFLLTFMWFGDAGVSVGTRCLLSPKACWRAERMECQCRVLRVSI